MREARTQTQTSPFLCSYLHQYEPPRDAGMDASAHSMRSSTRAALLDQVGAGAEAGGVCASDPAPGGGALRFSAIQIPQASRPPRFPAARTRPRVERRSFGAELARRRLTPADFCRALSPRVRRSLAAGFPVQPAPGTPARSGQPRSRRAPALRHGRELFAVVPRRRDLRGNGPGFALRGSASLCRSTHEAQEVEGLTAPPVSRECGPALSMNGGLRRFTLQSDANVGSRRGI